MENTSQWMLKYTVSNQILDRLTNQLLKIKTYYPEISFDDIFNSGLTFKNISWYETIIPILSEIYPNNRHQDIGRSINDKQYGGKIWLNSRFKNRFTEDVLKFEFTRLFPEVIWNLYSKGDIKFNNNCIGDLFGDLLNITDKNIEDYVKNKSDIIKVFNYDSEKISGISSDTENISSVNIINERIIQHIKMFKRITINHFYGLLSNPKNNVFYCEDFNIIPRYCHNLLNIIIEKFKDDIIYLDTSVIYFRYSKNLNIEKFKKIIEMSELPYEFKNGHEKIIKYFPEWGGRTFEYGTNSLYNGIFLEVKRYLLFDKDQKLIKKCGIIDFKEKTEDKYLNLKINKFYNNVKIE